ncbi:Transcriptional activator protein UGA3 [Fusarium oxysporum f. sp. rapae]|uniref:Transcriptional activator protein UGA3 n=1 Tax=Fusarium oxysporum f. sp. rapae TaxID=485398 RepID=A0A8J5NP96_FUSOX|nr:Transcriptional activator protein UGA3 [Fusarium oxysporum f. sp. rapae]
MASSTRSRHGCWTCCRRHQRCGEEKPACLNCCSRGAECGGYAVQLADFSAYNGPHGQMVSKVTRGRPTTQPKAKGVSKKQPKPLTTDHRASPTMPKPNCNLEERLLQHFMANLSVHLYPVNQARNPYTTVYAILAKESRPMLDGILFSSAMHLTNLGHLDHTALKPYRSARQKSFRGAIQAGDNYWALGLTVLLSVALDVIGTGMDLWSSKLAGCRKLLELGLTKSPGPIDAGQKYEIYSEPLDDSDMAFQQQHWWANMPGFRMHLLLREATDLAVEVQKAKESGDIANILKIMPQLPQSMQIQWCISTVSGGKDFSVLCITISIISTPATRGYKAVLSVRSVL